MGEKLWISVTNHEDDFVAEKQEGLLEKSYYTLHLKTLLQLSCEQFFSAFSLFNSNTYNIY
jgi:hypothetical protein